MPNYNVAALGQILDANFLRQFPMTQNEFGPETNSNIRSMKLAFRPYVDRRIRTSDVAWASNLCQAAPGLRRGLEIKLDWASMWLGGPCCSSTPPCSSPCVPWSELTSKI
jgi:hypothetical protein